MDELKAVIASNIIRLRTESGMTQAELGEKLNYSDKSISKWERAEGVPDALVLKNMSELFGVTVDYILTGHDQWEKPREPAAEKVEYSRLFIIFTIILGIWLISITEFVIMWIIGYLTWQVFVFAVPVSLITLLVLNTLWNKGHGNVYIVALLVAVAVAVVYLITLKHNYLQLFLLIPPAELLVYFAFNIKKRPKKQ